MEKTIDFVLIGRITIDLNPTDYYNSLDQLNNFQKYIGGSTGNTAIGLHRQKQKVVLVSKVSQDQFGQYILACLHQEQMVTDYVYLDPDHPTGLTFTEMLSPEKSTILMYRNQVADLHLQPQEIDPCLIAKAKFLVVSGTALSASPSREAVLKAILWAKNFETKVVFDIDYRPYNWTSQAEVETYYQLVAQQADLIIGSQEEIALCSAFTPLAQKPFNSQAVATYWLQTCELIIIKKGKAGSELFTASEQFQVGIIPVAMLKGFGGGDAYAAYFLSSYNQNPHELSQALIYASAAASYMVQSHSSFDHPDHVTLTKWLLAQTNNAPESLILSHKKQH